MEASMMEALRVRAQRIADSSDDRPTLRALCARVDEAIALAKKIETGASGVRGNVMIPVEGRRRTLQNGATDNAKAIQRLENAIADEMRMLGNERRFREKLPAAPTDPLSIQLRAELRAHLRSMPDSQRLAAVRLENLDPVTLAAILEAPSNLTGVPHQMVEHLRSKLVTAKGVGGMVDDAEVASLTNAAVVLTRRVAAAASELDPQTWEGRVSSVRVELTAAVDRTDADLPTLLATAVGYESMSAVPAVAA